MPKGHPQSGAGNRFGFWGVEMRFMLFALAAAAVAVPANAKEIQNVRSLDIAVSGAIRQHCALGSVGDMDFGNLERSEEHTSELQSIMSISYAVFGLKTKNKQDTKD